MCFPRKPSLGRYHASKPEWVAAFRRARIAAGKGLEPDPKTSGVIWKAQLIVWFQQNGSGDPLESLVSARLAANRLIDEILAD